MAECDACKDAVPVATLVPLDQVAELAEGRLRQRWRTSRRWWLGFGVPLLLAVLGAVPVVIALLVDARVLQLLEERAIDRLGYLRDAEPFIQAPQLGLGDMSVEMGVHQRKRYALAVEAGAYRIEAIAMAADFDPSMYLYRRRNSQTAVDAISYDDDGGGGLNARIDAVLSEGTTYYLEIEEFTGAPGTILLRIMRMNQ